jgi:hypothetical protein
MNSDKSKYSETERQELKVQNKTTNSLVQSSSQIQPNSNNMRTILINKKQNTQYCNNTIKTAKYTMYSPFKLVLLFYPWPYFTNSQTTSIFISS